MGGLRVYGLHHNGGLGCRLPRTFSSSQKRFDPRESQVFQFTPTLYTKKGVSPGFMNIAVPSDCRRATGYDIARFPGQ